MTRLPPLALRISLGVLLPLLLLTLLSLLALLRLLSLLPLLLLSLLPLLLLTFLSLLTLLAWLRLLALLSLSLYLLIRLSLLPLPALLSYLGLSLPFRPAGCAGNLAVNLFGEGIEFALSAAKGGCLIAENAFGRALNTLAQLLDPLAGSLRCLHGLLGDSRFLELFGHFESVRNLLLGSLASRIVKVLGEERLRLLGLLHSVLHLVEDLVEVLALLL